MHTLLNGSAVASQLHLGHTSLSSRDRSHEACGTTTGYHQGTGAPASGIRHKGQGHAVVAVALTGGTRAEIIEDMALMTTAAAAVFGAGNDQRKSTWVSIASGRGCQKLGQPVPLSNLVLLANRGC